MSIDRQSEFTLDTEMGFSVKVDEQSVEDALQEAISKNPAAMPHVVIFDQPYAIYQEYGTLPHTNIYHRRTPHLTRRSKTHLYGHDSFGTTEAQQRFLKWAQFRAGGRNPRKVARIAYYTVMKRGLNPKNEVVNESVGFHPFARPALYEVSALAQTPTMYSSVKAIAEDIRNRAVSIMTEHDWVASGALKDTIVCRPQTPQEIVSRGLVEDHNESEQ